MAAKRVCSALKPRGKSSSTIRKENYCSRAGLLRAAATPATTSAKTRLSRCWPAKVPRLNRHPYLVAVCWMINAKCRQEEARNELLPFQRSGGNRSDVAPDGRAVQGAGAGDRPAYRPVV